MKKNMGSADKAIRLILAAIMIFLYFSGIVPRILGIVLVIFAVIFILTSFIGSCPLYLPFGLSTIRKKLNS